MTEKDKQLLLQDLSARLPYGVNIQTKASGGNTTEGVLWCIEHNETRTFVFHEGSLLGYNINEDIIKPYLRPMSSMTEEEKEELLNLIVGKEGAKQFHITNDGDIVGNYEVEQDIRNFNLYWISFNPLNVSSYIGYLNKKMFDYRGLIPKGLAISTEVFNPYKD